jgi:hypothetical protein
MYNMQGIDLFYNKTRRKTMDTPQFPEPKVHDWATYAETWRQHAEEAHADFEAATTQAEKDSALYRLGDYEAMARDCATRAAQSVNLDVETESTFKF